jgi:4-amino-4-deoxy-L-arabinose transferase-like glycosyltransferase
VALLLPAAAFVVYCMWTRDWQRWRTLHPVRGVLLLAITTAPWMIAIQLRVPDFFDFFIVREHFLRYLTPIAERTQPWWFFIPLLLVGTLPWCGALLRPLFTEWRASVTHSRFSDTRLLWVSAVAIFLFFSASHSKLVPYILPMVPLLWVLASGAQRDPTSSMRRSAIVSLVLAAAGALALGWILVKQPAGAHVVLSIAGYLSVIVALIAVGSIAALVLRASSAKNAMIALGSAWMVAATVLELGPAPINDLYSAKELARTLTENGADAAPVFSVDTYDQTLTFYLGHPVRLVRYHGELDFGIARAPELFVPTLDDFLTIWHATPHAFAVMHPKTYEELRHRETPMRLLAKSSNLVAVARE